MGRRILLFTGGGGAGSEGIARLWGDRYDLHFADADLDSIPPGIANRHLIPFANDSAFVPEVAALCRRLGVDVLVPGVDEELATLSERAAELAPTRVMLPDAGFIRAMLDKLCFALELGARGIAVPPTYTLDQIAALGFPCLAKPRTGRGSRGVQILAGTAEAEAYGVLSGKPVAATIVQPLLVGTEYTVLLSSDAAGVLKAVIPVKVAVKRGVTVRAEIDFHPVVLDACRRVHAAWPAAGCINVQGMLSADGRFLPFEINPRISTTFVLGIAAGLDPVDVFLGGSVSPDLQPRKLSRHWFNVIE